MNLACALAQAKEMLTVIPEASRCDLVECPHHMDEARALLMSQLARLDEMKADQEEMDAQARADEEAAEALRRKKRESDKAKLRALAVSHRSRARAAQTAVS